MHLHQPQREADARRRRVGGIDVLPAEPRRPLAPQQPVQRQRDPRRPAAEVADRQVTQHDNHHRVHAEQGDVRAVDVAQRPQPGEDAGHGRPQAEREQQHHDQDAGVDDRHRRRVGDVEPGRPEVLPVVVEPALVVAPLGPVALVLDPLGAGQFGQVGRLRVPVERRRLDREVGAKLGGEFLMIPGVDAEELLQVEAVDEVDVQRHHGGANADQAERRRVGRGEEEAVQAAEQGGLPRGAVAVGPHARFSLEAPLTASCGRPRERPDNPSTPSRISAPERTARRRRASARAGTG